MISKEEPPGIAQECFISYLFNLGSSNIILGNSFKVCLFNNLVNLIKSLIDDFNPLNFSLNTLKTPANSPVLKKKIF